MNAELSRAVDALATRDPEHCGYGYADSQHPWHHDPAIDHPRTAFLEFLQHVASAPRRTAVVIGLGQRGTIHRALRLVAERVISIDTDRRAIAALLGQQACDPVRDFVLAEQAGSDSAQRAIAQLAPAIDVLLLDLDSGYAAVRDAWQRHAGAVGEGGIVAITDRSQVDPGTPELGGVDVFVADLERDFLMPRGVRLQRFGGAHAIFCYVQTAASRAIEGPLPWPGERAGASPERLGECLGFVLHSWQGRCLAVRGGGDTLGARDLLRSQCEVVLVAVDAAEAAAAVAAWVAVEPVLGRARQALADHDHALAQRLVDGVAATHPGLREVWLPSLEQSPWNRALLRALGTLSAFTGRPHEGVALLARALGTEMVDAELLRTVAAGYLTLLADERGARALLERAKVAVRARRVAQVCHAELRGHVLWHYPQLLAAVRGVLQVGAHRGGLVPAWRALGIAAQCLLEPQPDAFRALQRTCAEHGVADAVLLPAAVGDREHQATLRWGTDPARASLLRPHPLAGAAGTVQDQGYPVAVTTLDALVAAGALDPRRYDLLFVDTEGTELEVLRGARELLRHVEVISVRVFLHPVYGGAALPEQLQQFLGSVFGTDGFLLRAFEPSADPAWGEAVFRRQKGRR
jgi:FkbM family methyltransferase